MKQHLVSRVLLRRWSNHQRGPIAALDLDTLAERIDKVEDLGCVGDLVAVGAEHAERRWQDVERRLPHAFSQLDAGRLFNDPRAAATIRDAIALHYARGVALASMMRRMQALSANRVADGVLAHVDPARLLHALTALVVPDAAAVSLARDRIHAEFHGHLERQGFLGRQFLEHFDIARSKVAEYSLEVCTAVDHEFVIADVPVIAYDKDADAVGILQGVPWGNADAILMALGPRQVVALSRDNRDVPTPTSMAIAINSLQVRGAYKEVFFRPGSGLGATIASAIRASRQTPPCS